MRAGTSTLFIAAALCLASPPAAAQSFLDEFTSEGLRFSGVGLDFGGTWSDRLDPTSLKALRSVHDQHLRIANRELSDRRLEPVR